MTTDYTRKMMQGYLDRRKKGGGSFNKDKQRFPWQEGRNNLRLLPFEHTVTEFDLKRAGRMVLPFMEADLGKKVTMLVVPVVRYFKRGSGGFVKNGVGTKDCPMLQDFLSEKGVKREDRSCPRPDDFFVANVMCMDDPGRGVMQIAFKRSEWLGPMTKNRTKAGYGIWDVLAGYDPEPQTESETEEGEEAIGRAQQTLLGPIPSRYEDVVGFNAQDIVVLKKMGKVGGNACLLMDDETAGGCLRIRHASKCAEIDQGRYGQGTRDGVRDLLVMPEFYPGWSSTGEHLSADADEFASVFGNPVNQKRAATKASDVEEEGEESLGGPVDHTPATEQGLDEVEDDTPAPKPDPEPTPEPKKEKKKRKATPRKKKEVGSRVTFKQGGTQYLGTILEIVDKDAKVGLKPEDQPNEKAKQDVQDLLDQKHDCAVVSLRTLKVV